ncbi:MAG: bifunctional phosphopantothenoylcysteine decarboxylase/phosphopantothenate--cysteine ligase CoaBC [Glaciecola sp.]|nr:bifunctional phosphopantothenoylcysteine decarboxylase/phosphopantothenate--cysteine ligase CoaBC [Glaciecola sp.]MDG1816849.1 bifunctional phosphopantothenoylcysteine decarboxylase/phosphopantothenate--cysteine ligase CoaBC [Glaciecola sp.]MDG2099883.1 bifunctional phosphopantothenoylcysteine decarboxylase/phosphopantothenate--cysteine ligase CoaBC [Glaciecola sp.]
MSLQNVNVLLGVTGGIAAYKAPDLVRKLTGLGANVRVVLSPSSAAFVTPLSLQAVSGNIVHQHLLDPEAEAGMGHIELARWADVLLIAPATAHCIAKLAHGMADDLLTTLVLATPAPVFIAPAMNQQMWAAQATQANLKTINERGVTCFGPASGEQACGDIGYGRMLETVEIAQLLDEALASRSLLVTETQDAAETQDSESGLLAGKHIVITAGPTREAIDPVRYISNHSSGKMGYSLAIQALALGAQVTLVSGPVDIPAPIGCTVIQVQSAVDMHTAVMHAVQHSCDIFIACAAVADYRVADIANQKIKKDNDEMTLTLVKNPDILADVAALSNPPFTLGFAAETHDVERYARGKLTRKKLNMIAANDVSQPGIGFNQSDNALTVFTADTQIVLPQQDKLALAKQLLTIMAHNVSKH